VQVTGRDDYLAGNHVAGRCRQPPTRGLRVDPLDRGVQPQLDPVLTSVPVEMGDHLVAAREHRRSLRIPATRQVRERPAGVQFQPVIPSPPGGANFVGPLDQDGTQSAVLQADGRCDTGRTRADDHHLELSHPPPA